MKRGQRKTSAQRKRNAAYLRWRNRRDAAYRAEDTMYERLWRQTLTLTAHAPEPRPAR